MPRVLGAGSVLLPVTCELMRMVRRGARIPVPLSSICEFSATSRRSAFTALPAISRSVSVAKAHPGVSTNVLTDNRAYDVASGTAVLFGTPVSVEPLA